MSDKEGNAARVAVSKCGQRANFNYERKDARCLERSLIFVSLGFL
jgi:hypothetical protein